MYVGGGVILRRKSTVGAMRGSRSEPAKCKPPMILDSVGDQLQKNGQEMRTATYHVDWPRKCGESIFDDVDDASV